MLVGLFATSFCQSVKLSFLNRFNNLTVKVFYATMSGNLKIGTHDGSFHCDEALGCFLLKLLPRYKDAVIVRSREPSVINSCDIVLDVGGVYDHSKLRYDHHMRDFKETFSTVMKKPGNDSAIKLSSAGLIYCHYGHEIIREILPKGTSDDNIDCIFKNVYESFIKEIDGIDNGVPICDGGELLYRIKTDLSSRVGRLNPTWISTDQNQDEQFLKAVELTGEDFMYFVNYTANVWLPCRSVVQECLAKRFEIDPSGEIIELSQNIPWIEHLLICERELNINPTIKYAILVNNECIYRIRAVPVAPSSFICRVPLPEAWRGLRNDELSKVCGVDGAVFVHKSGFIGEHKTREGALAMARKALDIGKSSL